MTRVKIGMPQMAARGLSENWLFKYCGDAHWQEITRLYGMESHELTTEEGDRVYSSFVAIRARYARPIGTIAENAVIDFTTEVDRFGTAVLRTRQHGMIDGVRAIDVEMITKFVMRAKPDSNDLLRASVRPRSAISAVQLDTPPALLRDFQAVRGNKDYALPVPEGLVEEAFPPPLTVRYSPNPYVDYNGAGLLYFASYPAIADHIERMSISPPLRDHFAGDWALAASTVARDIFYFGNLDLGSDMSGAVSKLDLVGRSFARTHTQLTDADSSRRLAEVYTLKALHTD